jgi:hypothetical protein
MLSTGSPAQLAEVEHVPRAVRSPSRVGLVTPDAGSIVTGSAAEVPVVATVQLPM